MSDLEDYANRVARLIMLDVKIEESKMGTDMQEYAIGVARGAFAFCSKEKFVDITKYIKNNFDKRYEKAWGCVVGNDSAVNINYEEDKYIVLRIDGVRVILWKNGVHESIQIEKVA